MARTKQVARQGHLEQEIRGMVGQDAAIKTVATLMRRKKNGWMDTDRPLVFMFLGPSKVGKTELAKQVARYLHNNKKEGFVRLNMSEYQEELSVDQLIGCPLGSEGHEKGGQLTNALNDCKKAVVLLDEIEKAHPKVLTVLFQLFDEGQLIDRKGTTIKCKDAIFIMKSKLASEAIVEHTMQQRAKQAEHCEKRPRLECQENNIITDRFKSSIVRPILKEHFRSDEYLKRIDEIAYFKPFSDQELEQFVTRELCYWSNLARRKHSIDMIWDHLNVWKVIVDAYDKQWGPDSIKQEVVSKIITPISELQSETPRKKPTEVEICVKTSPADMSRKLDIKMN